MKRKIIEKNIRKPEEEALQKKTRTGELSKKISREDFENDFDQEGEQQNTPAEKRFRSNSDEEYTTDEGELSNSDTEISSDRSTPIDDAMEESPLVDLNAMEESTPVRDNPDFTIYRDLNFFPTPNSLTFSTPSTSNTDQSTPDSLEGLGIGIENLQMGADDRNDILGLNLVTELHDIQSDAEFNEYVDEYCQNTLLSSEGLLFLAGSIMAVISV